MKLEQQVCSLELAKKLKELGVKQESHFRYCGGHTMYHDNDDGDFVECYNPDLLDTDEYCDSAGLTCEFLVAAFTVAELGEMLPMHHNYGSPQSGKCNGGHEYQADYIHWGNLWYDREQFDRYKMEELFVANTEADARAKMLIYLLENNLIPKEGVDGRETRQV